MISVSVDRVICYLCTCNYFLGLVNMKVGISAKEDRLALTAQTGSHQVRTIENRVLVDPDCNTNSSVFVNS